MQIDASRMETLLTAEEVAHMLRVSQRKFEDMVKAGRAPAFVRMGRLRRWEPEVVKSWLKENRVGYASPEEDQS
jgi:excisionase family DNA binding protein